MQWLRQHLRYGSQLALLTLVIQFVATFGHFHPLSDHATAFATEPITTVVAERRAADQRPSTKQAAETDDAKRSHHHHAPGEPDICSICAVMALADAALPAMPPVLLPPWRSAALLLLIIEAAFVHLERAGTAFQSRAPPVS